MARGVPALRTVQRVPVPEPEASITTGVLDTQEPGLSSEQSLALLSKWAREGGNIAGDLDPSVLKEIGVEAMRRWSDDDGSRQLWKEEAELALKIATQERDVHGVKDYPFENASDIHYPLLTVAAIQFNGRAMPALVKGDKVFGVKVFEPPAQQPSPVQTAQAGPQPQNPMEAQQASQQIMASQQQASMLEAALQARRARAERVSMWLNYVAFYKMDNWRGEMDTLTMEGPVVGIGFKKVYRGPGKFCSEYVSALKLTVHNDTKNLWKCPRITLEFQEYPYEIAKKQRLGLYERIVLPPEGNDPQRPRDLIEQLTLLDLDEDGFDEPYILTVDQQTQQVLRVEPNYFLDDVMVNAETNEVTRINHHIPYAPFVFLPDPKGRFYALGFGKLVESVMDSVDTSMNQLIDAGTAEIAGGGFIAGGVRLQGSGEAGVLYYRPGEYQTVATPGGALKDGVWERTVPHPSAVTMSLLELLLNAAKSITSTGDVMLGDTQPANAPVGTTVAVMDQALEVQSAILGRYWDGLRMEGNLLYNLQKRYMSQEDMQEYAELTGGNMQDDFSGDGTDIQAAADPRVITKMQKIARNGAIMQLAESPLGMAAGMTQPKSAQKIARDALESFDIDSPDSYFAPVQPDPVVVAKAQDISAAAQKKEAELGAISAKVRREDAAAVLDQAKAVREIGLAAHDTHAIHQETDRMQRDGRISDETAEEPDAKEVAGAKG